MLELFVIVTRMTGTPNEFSSYFDDNDWAVIYDDTNTIRKIPASQNTLTYDKNNQVVYVDGVAVKNDRDICDSFRNFLDRSAIDRKTLILIHPGAGDDFEIAKNRILCCNGKANQINEINIIIAKYSHTSIAIFDVVGSLAKQIKDLSNNIDTNINKIREYVLKKNPKPHLLALSILCQGYLAAHGGKVLKGWKDLPAELKNKVSKNRDNVKDKWWNIIDIEQATNELKDKDTDNKISNLLSQIKDNMVNENTVEGADTVLTKILAGK